ncbi:hypothetical protein, partial [Pseudomonas sp. R31(2017)]|uniref:hypothetical protein n=1 Tax=Pseudomonas sp. R31(2017) TaxID=1981691 RepID=UPI001C443581
VSHEKRLLSDQFKPTLAMGKRLVRFNARQANQGRCGESLTTHTHTSLLVHTSICNRAANLLEGCSTKMQGIAGGRLNQGLWRV